MGRAGRWRLCACCMLCSPFMGHRARQLASLGVPAVPSMTGHRTGFSLCVKGFLYIFLFTLPQKAMRQAL